MSNRYSCIYANYTAQLGLQTPSIVQPILYYIPILRLHLKYEVRCGTIHLPFHVQNFHLQIDLNFYPWNLQNIHFLDLSLVTTLVGTSVGLIFNELRSYLQFAIDISKHDFKFEQYPFMDSGDIGRAHQLARCVHAHGLLDH